MIPIRTLYLLLNDETYRLLHGLGAGMAEIHHSKAELVAAGAGHGSHDEIGREHLAKHAAKVLAAEWAKGLNDRIVIAAGPKMLGEIRRELPKGVMAHVAAELHKDLIKTPIHDLPAHFMTVSTV
jgi:protein required for attachment to host cells